VKFIDDPERILSVPFPPTSPELKARPLPLTPKTPEILKGAVGAVSINKIPFVFKVPSPMMRDPETVKVWKNCVCGPPMVRLFARAWAPILMEAGPRVKARTTSSLAVGKQLQSLLKKIRKDHSFCLPISAVVPKICSSLSSPLNHGRLSESNEK